MKKGAYLALILGLVPIQASLLDYASLGGIRPDLCLIASFLIGFLSGEARGTVMGLVLGFIQDLFSAGQLGLNVLTKGAIGLLGGIFGRHLAHATPLSVLTTIFLLSVVSGAVVAVAVQGRHGLESTLALVQGVVVPQGLYDAGLGALLYWLLPGYGRREDEFVEEITLFGR